MKHPLIVSVFLLLICSVSAQNFDFEADVTQGCSPQKVVFLNRTDESVKNDYSYEWTVETGKFSTQTDSVQNTYLNSGKYDVTMKVFDKSKKNLIQTVTKPQYITIYNDPDVTIKTNKTSTCEDKGFQFSIDKIMSDTVITSYTWVLSDGTVYEEQTPPEHTFWFAGEFDVFLSIQDAHGCTNRERKSISVVTYNDYPMVAFTPSVRKTCDARLDVTFKNTSDDSNVLGYHWDFGDGTTYEGKTPPKHTFYRNDGDTTYYVELSGNAKSKCVGAQVFPIQLIDYRPEIQVSDEFPEVSFDTVNYYSYLELDSLSTCPCKNHGEERKIITNENKACVGKIHFDDKTPSNDNISWEWKVYKKNGEEKILVAESEEQSFYEYFSESGMYIVTLKTSNGICTDEVSKIFYVEEPLEITVKPDEGFYCELPVTVDYSATSNVPGTQFLWQVGYSKDFYLGNNFSEKHTSEGAYKNKVFAISPNYCRYTQSISKEIEITLPHLNKKGSVLSWQNEAIPRSGCKALDVEFPTNYFYETEQDSIVSIAWFYGDKNNSSSKIDFDARSANGIVTSNFTYADTGVYEPLVLLVTDKGCVARDTLKNERSVVVGDVPNISLEYDKDVMCASEILKYTVDFKGEKERYVSENDTLIVTLVNELEKDMKFLSSPITDTYEMSIRDTLGIHTSYFYVSDNGCSAIVEDGHQVRVNGPLLSVFQSPKDCENPLIHDFVLRKAYGIEDLSWSLQKFKVAFSEIANDVDSIRIDFDDYGGRGPYSVAAYSQNAETGCDMGDTVYLTVTSILCDYELNYETYCLNSHADFNVSCSMGQDISSWSWYYDWNGITKSAKFAECSAGALARFDQPVTKTTVDDCGNVQEYIIDPDPSVLDLFDTTNITSVTVVASDIYGCTDTLTKPITIAAPRAEFMGDLLSDCLPFEVTFTDTSNSPSVIKQRIWSIDGKTISSLNNKEVSALVETQGFKTVSLKVVDEFGCSDLAEKVKYLKPVVPNTKFSVEHPYLCFGFDAVFNRNLNAKDYENVLTHYSWDFGDGIIEENEGDLAPQTIHSYKAPSKTEYSVQLKGYAISPQGNECVDSTIQKIDVKKTGADIKIRNSDLCKEPGQKFIMYLDNSIYNSNIRKYDWWKFDGGDSVYIGNKKSLQVVTFNNYGNQKLCLRTQSDYFGCEDSTLILPVVVPGYDVHLIADKDSACIHEDILFTLLDTSNLSSYNCYWEFGDGNSQQLNGAEATYDYTSLANTENNTYKVQFIVDAEGCKPRDISVNVTIFPVISNFTRGLDDLDTIGCPPYSVVLYNTSIADESASYLWNLGNGVTSTEKNPKVTIDSLNMILPVSLLVTSDICNDKLTKNVSTYPPATISVDMDSSICVGETIKAFATGDFTSIQWEPRDLFTNSRSPMTDVKVRQSQHIYMETTNKYGCKNIDSIYVFVQQKPYYFGAPKNSLLFYDSNDSLVPTSVKSDLIAGQKYNLNVKKVSGVMYSWSPGTYLSCTDCASPDLNLWCEDSYDCLNFPENLQYTVVMADTLGCFSNDTTINFKINFDTKIAMPEAFTPNEDGVNDIAYVRGWGIREFIEVKIYNRWGQLVFESDDMARGWDGTFNGEPQSMDTYAYTIKAKDVENKEIFVKGYITLLR